MSVLARTVWVERGGERVCLRAGTTPPVWATELVTNPAAYAETEMDGEEPTDTAEPGAKAAETQSDLDEAKIPPKAGRGSSAAAWAAYAKSHGFEVEEDAKASEIRDALVEAGVPVE